MAAITNPQEAFLESKIMSAPKEALTLMLYEGALKFANQAIHAIETQKQDKVNGYIKRVCDIIQELQLTLDRKYPISKEFDALYDYVIDCVTEGAAGMDAQKIRDAADIIREFRDTWSAAMKNAKQEQSHAAK